jgi:hypothetical protein
MAKTLINLSSQAQGRVLTLGTESGLPSSLLLHKGTGNLDSILLDAKGSVNVEGGVFIATAPSNDLHATNKLYVDSLIGAAVAAAGYQQVISFTGSIDGVNKTFTIPSDKISIGSLQVFVNGMLQKSSGDYTVTGSNLEFSYIPASDDIIIMYATIPTEGGSPADAGAGAGTGVIPVTYSELRTHMTNSTLVVGGLYKITNFQTKHIINNSTHLNVNGTVYVDKATAPNNLSEGVEELIVFAVSTNAISMDAYSVQFPQDKISYDVSSNLCEDGVTPRNGRIVYRKDNVKNIELFYDWRKVVFIRYKLNPTAYSGTTTYNSGNIVLYNGVVYICLVSGTVGVIPSNASTNTAWAAIYQRNTNSFNLHVSAKTSGNNVGRFAVTVDTTSYRHVFTFNTITNATNETVANNTTLANVYNVSIGRVNNTSPYNNVVFFHNANGLKFDDLFDSTFANNITSVKFGAESGNILATSVIDECRFGQWVGENVFMNIGGFENETSTYGDGFRGNVMVSGRFNTFAANITNNYFKQQTIGNVFNSRSAGNIFHGNTNGNNIARLNACTFRGILDNCNILSYLSSCTFQGAVQRCVITPEFQNRTIVNALTDSRIDFIEPGTRTTSTGKLYGVSYEMVKTTKVLTMAGTVNGTNTVFTYTPTDVTVGSVAITKNGVLISPYSDYSINHTTRTITYSVAPIVQDTIVVWGEYSDATTLGAKINLVS